MNFFNIFARSWQFLVQCFRFFSQNKDLLFFPVVSIILSGLLLFILFAGGLLEIGVLSSFGKEHPSFSLLAVIVLYFLFSFIIIYFNASLIACAVERLQGKSASVGDGLELAAKHWWPLLQWTLLSTSVGFLLRILERSHSMIEELLAGLLGIAWTISTYFVIPIMVFENVGPFQAIKRGFSIFGRGWRRVLSIFLIFHLALIAVFAILYGLNHLVPNHSKLFFEIAVSLFLFLLLFTATIGSAFNGIINSALYLSYVENKDVAGFDPKLLKQAFAQKQ